MRIGVVLAIGLSASLFASIAHADLAQDQTRLRLAAEQHEKDAHLAKSDELYVKCAQAYLDLFNLAPDAPGGDEQLYNAGVCFHEGHSDGAAIPVWQRLEQKYPSSKLRSRVVARLALTYDDAALWSKAAETWERYAAMFAGEKDAREALSQAIAIRKATGEDELLLKDSKYFLKAFGAKDPKTAAQAMYGMTEAYRRKGPAALELHLRDFLRQYARAELELRVRAMLELAESIWKRSCAVPGTDGLCLKLERSRVLPVAVKPPKPTPAAKRCGSASSTTLVVLPRDPRLASEASKLLVDTEKLAASSPSPQTNYFQARARLLLADQRLEAYVAVRFPTGLDFSLEQKRVRETSLKRFNDFISTRTKLGVDARTAYEAILTFKDPTAAIAASQRLAFVPQAMATDLLAAELPKDVRSGGDAKDKVEAFCDAMLPIAEPLFTQAIAGYEVCLAKASQLGIRNASTRACAREAAALAPTRFPLSTELLPEAPLALPVFDEPPVRKSPSLPVPFREDVERFWKVYGATPIPNGLCLPLAAKFAALGKLNRSADAWFMSGLTYGRCQREENGKAKAAYEAALALDPKHGKSMSNLGELAIRAGQPYVAKAQWEAAVLVNPKLFSANLGLATVALREYRALPANDPARAKLRGEIELRARSAAALDPDNALPFVQLGILALLDGKPVLAKYLAYRAEKYDPTPHVQLLHAALANGETEALPRLEAAQTNTWQIPETRLALAIQQLALARYDDAAKTLAQVAPSYEVLLARGVAARGLGKLADAEARYTEASKLDPARVEAHFNLGVLFKDHVAARATDPAAAKTAFKKAADAFRRANTPEAKLWADDCDKAATLL